MFVRITITAAFLHQIHWRLVDAPDGIALRAGVSRDETHFELLLPGPRAEQVPSVSVRACRLDPHLRGTSHLFPRLRPERTDCHLDLWLYEDRGCSATLFLA